MTVAVMLSPSAPSGTPVDASAPQLRLDDQGVTRGDGVFETLLRRRGVVRELDAHLERLQGSADALELAIPARTTWEAAIAHALSLFDAQSRDDVEGNDPGEAAVKLVATRGPEGGATTAWVSVNPAHRPERSDLAVVLLDRGYEADLAERAPWLLLGAKTLSYAVNMAAVRWAKAHDADDAVFITPSRRLLEGTTSSLLIARRDGDKITLLTPELEAGILAGTTQAAAFDVAREAGWELGYGPLTVDDLLTADAAWLVSSVRLAMRITRIDGAEMATDDELDRVLSTGLETRL